MLDGLFREEAVEARRGQWLGSVIVVTPLSRWLITTLALALAAAVLAILILGQYTRRVAVSGQLVPSAGMLRLTAQNAGRVSFLGVHEGQQVKAGDVLLRLTDDLESTSLGNTRKLVEQQLDLQRARLQADILNQKQLSTQVAKGFRAQATSIRAQLTEIHEQMAIQQRVIASGNELLERVEPLAAKGFVSGLQIQHQRTALLEAQANYKALVLQQLDAQQKLGTVEQRLAQVPLNDADKQNEIERQISSVTQSMARNEMLREPQLRAPRDGVVSAILISEGQVVTPGQPLLSIVPKGADLVAQFLVPSHAIGFVEPGSRVILRYQAFPYQKFGQQYGKVTEVSRSALSPKEVSALIGQESQLSEPLYRILVKLDSQHIRVYGRDEPMKPGMVVDADILLDRRSLIEWILEPLYSMSNSIGEDGPHG